MVLLIAVCCGLVCAQQTSLTWSTDCADCESSILNPGWYSDGSGILMEGIHGRQIGAMAGLSGMDIYFAVAVGFGVEGEGTVAVNPRQSVTLETDSGGRMVLCPVDRPDMRAIKGTVVEKKRLGDKTVTLKAGATAAGYLLFPADNQASRVTVVVNVGNETFRFPFVRNASARAKFQPASDNQDSVANAKSEPSPSAPPASAQAALTPTTSGGNISSLNAAPLDRNQEIGECAKQLDIRIFPADTCSQIYGALAPTESLLLGPFEDGSMMILTTDGDKKMSKLAVLPPKIRSEVALKSATKTVRDVEGMATPNSEFAEMLPEARDLWQKLRDAYCYYHPNQNYVDLSGSVSACPNVGSLPDAKALEAEFSGAMTFKNNYETFLEGRAAERMQSQSAASTKVFSTRNTAASTPAVRIDNNNEVMCRKNISLAVAGGGRMDLLVPDFARKWISKNSRKYDGVCFSQTPVAGAENYLLVFSTTESAFDGIYPRLKTNTSTSTTPVSGSGTVTDSYGGMWNYTYDGTVTTTTTTTVQENLPYRDTSDTLYLHSYNQNGRLISERWRTVTSRQGGDGMGTLGYNLGSSLSAIHFKEHLLKATVADVIRAR